MKSAVPENSFRILAPADSGPLVYAAPHAGRRIPESLRAAARVDARALRDLEDPLIDRLVESAAGQGVTVLICEAARAFADVNRDPAELDPQLIEGARSTTARVKAGLGVLPRVTGDGRPIHGRRLSMSEAEARIAEVHAPYHAALRDLMESARAAHGRAVLVDWHSMPSRAAEAEGERAGRRPAVVLGDLHGRACGPEIAGRVRAVLEAEGFPVAMNRPYAGGYVTQTWGRPREGLHALQVEIDRSLYLDEATLEPHEGFERLHRAVEAVTEGLLELLAPRAAAAE